MSTLSVFLFREVAILRDQQPITRDVGRKACELLSFLLLDSTRPHRRETLMAQLWEDASDARAQRNMRQTLWQLQHELHEADAGDERILLVDADWIQVNPQATIWCDVHIFREAFRQAQGVEGRDLSGSQVAALQAAVTLYRGGLLEGWYQDWCLIERENLQNFLLMILDKLMDYCEANRRFDDGIVYGMHSLKLDITRERSHRRLMRLYALLGDRSSALRQFEQCAAALRQELNVVPSERTLSLVRRIRNDEPMSQAGELLRGHALVPPAAVDLSRLLLRLTQLSSDLDQAYQRIKQDVELVADVLVGEP